MSANGTFLLAANVPMNDRYALKICHPGRLAFSAGFHPSRTLAPSSNILCHHLDGAAGAFGGAHTAALAVVIIETEAVARAELDDRIVGANAVTVVAFEAVAA